MRYGRLEAIVFIAGFGVMVTEIGGARILASYFGDALFTWTSSISVVLASLALGYYLGGRLADRLPHSRSLPFLLLAACAFMFVIPFAAQAVLLFCLNLGYEYGPLPASVLLLAAPNVFLGAVSPFAVRIKAKAVKVIGRSAGNLYAVSTVGSIVGALLSGYVLLPFIGVEESFVLAGILLLASGVAALGYKALPLLAAVAIVLLPVPQLYPSSIGNTLYQGDTPYYHLAIVNDSGILQLKTNILGEQTLAYANGSSSRTLGYYIFQTLLYYGPGGVRSALYLGLGGGAMVSDLYQNTNASIDAVEIDPGVISAAAKYFGIENNSRVRIYNQDARFFLEQSSGKYDMIVLDTYGSSISIPYFLLTQEAANSMKQHLNANGSVLINLISPISGPNDELFRSVYKTLSSVFPNVYVFAGNPTNLSAIQNMEIIASTNATRKSLANFQNELSGKMDPQLAAAMLSGYQNGTINTTGFPILTDNANPVEVYVAIAESSLKASCPPNC